METVASLEEQLERLRANRAGGVKSAEIEAGNGGRKRVEYRSDPEIAAAIADLERRLAALRGGRVHTVFLYSSKGT